MPNKARRYTGKITPSKDRPAKVHKIGSEANRGNANERGYNYRWQKASKQYLLMNPLCVACKEMGNITAAQCVDHIEPHRGDDELFWDDRNWQSLCEACHNSKTGKGQ